MLEDHLINNEINKKNYESLRTFFLKENFIPFIGAGSSLPTGAVDWENLYKNLRDVLNIQSNLIKRDGIYNFPRSFSNLYKNKKLSDKSTFYKELFNCLKPTETNCTMFHFRLIKAFDTYITTNYDEAIEKAFEEITKSKLNRYFFSAYERSLDNSIVYLHGHSYINFAIIKEEDYEYFYPTVSKKNGIPIIEEFLKKIYLEKSLIFMGVSFNDDYLKQYFMSIVAEAGCKQTHFWLVNQKNRIYIKFMKMAEEYKKDGGLEKALEVENEFYNEFMKINIMPIVYDENVFVENLIGELATKTKETVIIESEISGNP